MCSSALRTPEHYTIIALPHFSPLYFAASIHERNKTIETFENVFVLGASAMSGGACVVLYCTCHADNACILNTGQGEISLDVDETKYGAVCMLCACWGIDLERLKHVI
jgi:hypothetical protein